MFHEGLIEKKQMIKGVIFDWGRTLYDSEAKKEFPESAEVLEYLKGKGYRLALVSLVTSVANATLEERVQQIENSPLRSYFEVALTTDTDKDKLFEQVILHFQLPHGEIALVDDRTIRGIRWGNKNGLVTIWLKKGRFAHELPDVETGEPDYTISQLEQLGDIM